MVKRLASYSTNMIGNKSFSSEKIKITRKSNTIDFLGVCIQVDKKNKLRNWLSWLNIIEFYR